MQEAAHLSVRNMREMAGINGYYEERAAPTSGGQDAPEDQQGDCCVKGGNSRNKKILAVRLISRRLGTYPVVVC